MSKAIIAGKLKLRNLYTLLSARSSWSDTLILDQDTCEDLEWWLTAVDNWNGSPPHSRPVQYRVWTDASSFGWGCGHAGIEASGSWDPATALEHINYKELLAVLFALKSFTPQLGGKVVQVMSDNATTVAYVNNMGGPVKRLTNLAERIWATAFAQGMSLETRHVSGESNVTCAAD